MSELPPHWKKMMSFMWDMKWKTFAFRRPPMFLFSGVNIASWANMKICSYHKQPQLQIFIKPQQLYLENISENWLIIASYTAYTLFSEYIKWHNRLCQERRAIARARLHTRLKCLGRAIDRLSQFIICLNFFFVVCLDTLFYIKYWWKSLETSRKFSYLP